MCTRRTPLLLLLAPALVLAGCSDQPEPMGPEVARPVFDHEAGHCVVTSTGNDESDPATVTLREAIGNTDCTAITFDVRGAIVLTSGHLLIDRDLTITGPGADQLTVKRSAAEETPEFRIFEIAANTTVAISGLTISGGVAPALTPLRCGGGILNFGTLTLSHSTVSGNSAPEGGPIQGAGGGICNPWGATLTLSHSTVSGNNTEHGGGILNYGTLTLSHSTVSGNNAQLDGGGIASATPFLDFSVGSTTIQNSTISGNTARTGGGVINVHGLTRILNSTITGNRAFQGGGVFSVNEETTLRTDVKGSIIWGNTTDGSTPNDLAALFDRDSKYNSLGYNLIGAGNNVDFTQVFNAVGDQVEAADAKLDPLADNGGPTETHALLASSPAIDAGTCTDDAGNTVLDDQRGVARPQGVECDIGAFELEVSVESPVDVINQIVARIQAIIDDNAGTPTAEELADVVEKLNEAVDELMKSPPDNQAAVQALEQAVSDLEPAVEDGLVDPGIGEKLMDDLAGVARQMAQQAIDARGDSEKIQEAEQSLAEGDDLRATKQFTAAIDKYKDALAEAERVPLPVVTSLVFKQQPSNTTTGNAIRPEVEVQILDQNDEPMTAATDPVTVTVFDASGAEAGIESTVAAIDGVATFSIAVPTAGEGYTLVASATGLTEATSDPFDVEDPIATSLRFDREFDNLPAGTEITIGVELLDQYDYRMTSVSGPVVTLTLNYFGGGSTDYFAPLEEGFGETVATLSETGTVVISAELSDLNLRTETPQIEVEPVPPASAAHSTITADPIEIPADDITEATITVRLADADGNVLTDVTGYVVTLATTAGELSALATQGDRFTATLTATTAGTATITGTLDGELIGDHATVTFTQVDPVPHQLRIVQTPSPVAASGVALDQQPIIEVLDANGNPVLLSGLLITANIAPGSPDGASVGGTPAFTDGSGQATFTDLSISGPVGDNYRLTFGVQGFSIEVTSEFIALLTGPPAAMSIFAGDGQVAQVGTPVTIEPAVRVVDSGGNPVEGAEVEFAPSDDGEVTGSPATTVPDGIATLGSWTLSTTAGTNTLLATVAGSPEVFVEFTATGTPGAPTQLFVTCVSASCTPSPDVDDLYGVSEGNTITLSAQLADEFGNLVAEAGRTVEWFRDGSPIGTSPTDDSGVTTFDYNVGTVSSNTTVTIMASDGQASGSVSIIIVAGSGGGGGGGIIF